MRLLHHLGAIPIAPECVPIGSRSRFHCFPDRGSVPVGLIFPDLVQVQMDSQNQPGSPMVGIDLAAR